MRGKSILVVCFVIGAVALAVALLPGGTGVAAAQGGMVTYNLYATDGYVEMADGNAVYAYGFVGAREVPGTFAYQTSCTPGAADPDGYRPCTGSQLASGQAPAPTGGPRTTNDNLLAGNAQFPAPIVYASTGDIVELRLKNLGVQAEINAPNDPHSIHLHGLDVDAANDGVPETSVGAVPANLCFDGTTGGANDPVTLAVVPADCGIDSLGNDHGGPAPGAGNVIVYMFSPTHEGTYMYHCHQEADIHVNMGMFGALVVYNPTDPAAATGPGVNTPGASGGMLYGVHYDKDYVMLLGEFDIRGHADEEGTWGTTIPANTWDPDPYNWALYEPQYWFVNGLSFPQTIHSGFPSGFTFPEWQQAHPGYDPLITGSVGAPVAQGGTGYMNQFWGTPGEKVLVRVINMGFETQPMHMHGYHGKVIGSDQRAWDWATAPKSKTSKGGARPFGEGLEKNTLTIGSGETYDWLIDFGQQSFNSLYEVGNETRYYDSTYVTNNGTCAADVAAAGLFPLENDPLSNTFVNCPAIPVNGDATAADGHYIGGPTVTGLMGGAADGAGIDHAGFAGQSQYFPFHNHDDYKATNNGVYPGGMFTFLVPTP